MRSLLALLLFATPSMAAKPDSPGIELVVQVLDASRLEEAVGTARVRHPDEKDPHPVNAQTGEWRGSVLYLPNGTEKVFDKDTALTFEVTAPGYMPAKFDYVMRKRKNKVQVLLVPMPDIEVCPDDDPECDVVIQFHRNTPRGGQPL